jgi:hypothetical protein
VSTETGKAVLIHLPSRNRPFHFGPFPLEVLPRDDVLEREQQTSPRVNPDDAAREGIIARAADHYREIYLRIVGGKVAPARAPIRRVSYPGTANKKSHVHPWFLVSWTGPRSKRNLSGIAG